MNFEPLGLPKILRILSIDVSCYELRPAWEPHITAGDLVGMLGAVVGTGMPQIGSSWRAGVHDKDSPPSIGSSRWLAAGPWVARRAENTVDSLRGLARILRSCEPTGRRRPDPRGQ